MVLLSEWVLFAAPSIKNSFLYAAKYTYDLDLYFTSFTMNYNFFRKVITTTWKSVKNALKINLYRDSHHEVSCWKVWRKKGLHWNSSVFRFNVCCRHFRQSHFPRRTLMLSTCHDWTRKSTCLCFVRPLSSSITTSTRDGGHSNTSTAEEQLVIVYCCNSYIQSVLNCTGLRHL